MTEMEDSGGGGGGGAAPEEVVEEEAIKEMKPEAVGVDGVGGGKGKVANEEEITEYMCHITGRLYRVGDTVYIESQRADMPYFICTVKQFTQTKKGHITVDVVWFYRPCEIPTSVYQLLLQDRHNEYGSNNILDDPIVKSRELFISDAIDVYPASALRGHAYCVPFSEIKENVPEYIRKEDNWFYILRYNPESRRMANAKGEIRIGASHQAICPIAIEDRTCKEALDDLNNNNREELLWSPNVPKSKLMVYLRAARSITSFNGYCETEDGCPEKALTALSKDQNTAHSYDVLHKNGYDISIALQELIRSPTPKKVSRPWTDDERKRFMRGLRSYGKTFHKIRKECLPDRETSEIVTYYYIWKKTPIAMNSRPHKRGGRRNNVLARKTRTTKAKQAEQSEYLDLSSCSENDIDDTDDSENARDLSLYACRHCFTTKSPNWHHGGKDKLLLCYACRMYYKRYGHMKEFAEHEKREPPPYIFKAAFENLDDSIHYSGRMRTRRSSTPVFTNANSLRTKLLQEGKICNRKQVTVPRPTGHDSDKDEKEDVEVNVTKRKGENDTDHVTEAKKRRDSDGEDADDESEDDSETGSRTELAQHPSTDGSPQSLTPDKSPRRETANGTEFSTGECDSTSTSPSTPVPLPDTTSASNITNEGGVEEPLSHDAQTHVKKETATGVEEEECEDSDVTPDVPDVPDLIQKIKSRFAHNVTEDGNSCSRCEMYYIHKRARKQRPTELDPSSKRREEYMQRKDATHKRLGTVTPPSSHQPAQITSHYETMRLLSAARGGDPQRFWPPGYPGQHEIHGHRPISPREYIGDPGGKFGHLLEALDNRPNVDIRSPRSTSVPGHPPPHGAHGSHGAHGAHGFPPRPVDINRDFRNNPPNRAHMAHHPPASLENMPRIPSAPMDGHPIERGPPIERGGPPMERGGPPMERGGPGPPMERQTIDPITGLPTMQPHLHSHHHTHTHLHVHPDDLKYNRHHGPTPQDAAHFERHERGAPLPHQPPHQPPQPTPPAHRPNSRGREYHEQLLKQYPDLLAQMHHDPHLRESIARHPAAGGVGEGVGDRRREILHTQRDGAASPSIPHDIPNAPTDPVQYHLWVTQYANMQRWKSHGGGAGQSHTAQAPELSPHGMPAPPRLPHDIRNEHEKHMKEKHLMYAHAEREQMARADHFRQLEHEKHIRSMLHNRDHIESVKLKQDHNMPPDHHPGFKPGVEIGHIGPYHTASPFIDSLRRAHDARNVPNAHAHERTFHDPLRFGHDRGIDRERVVHGERAPHPDRYTDRGRHERTSIFIGGYKPPETIDLSEE